MEQSSEKKYVKCPRCGQPSLYSKDNLFRPFCSERCKIIDLGDWATEKYSIPIEKSEISPLSDEDEFED